MLSDGVVGHSTSPHVPYAAAPTLARRPRRHPNVLGAQIGSQGQGLGPYPLDHQTIALEFAENYTCARTSTIEPELHSTGFRARPDLLLYRNLYPQALRSLNVFLYVLSLQRRRRVFGGVHTPCRSKRR